MAKKRPRGSGPQAGPEAERPTVPPEWPKLSSRHAATLAAIFDKPTRANVPWTDVERLFVALGGTVAKPKGSMRRVRLGQRVAVFHEPHPEKETDKGALEAVRSFLVSAGVTPRTGQ